MNYSPKHSQPFSFEQARELEIPVITNEISRLENSLFHLTRTQNELKEHLTGQQEKDGEMAEIIGENETVIASQKERIVILKLVLEQKGINARSTYYISTASEGIDRPAFSIETPEPRSSGTEGDPRPREREGSEPTDNGVYL